MYYKIHPKNLVSSYKHMHYEIKMHDAAKSNRTIISSTVIIWCQSVYRKLNLQLLITAEKSQSKYFVNSIIMPEFQISFPPLLSPMNFCRWLIASAIFNVDNTSALSKTCSIQLNLYHNQVPTRLPNSASHSCTKFMQVN